MPYKLEDINYMTVADPKGMIEEADAQYARKVEEAAEKILNNRKNSPIILLSGPSGSGPGSRPDEPAFYRTLSGKKNLCTEVRILAADADSGAFEIHQAEKG